MTPLQEIIDTRLEKAGVRLLVKREDLNDPHVSGNKWWKLKYNLIEAISQGYPTVLTFGGAFSNHLYATAAAARDKNLSSIGIVRGERVLPLNHTLSFASRQGMKLHFVSRDNYRRKDDPGFLDSLREDFGPFFPIPEGGTNLHAVRGCAELGTELLAIPFDHLVLAVGTGGTLAGIATAFKNTRNVIGIPVLKGGEFLFSKISNLIKEFDGGSYENWTLLTSYHHGGYAKVTKELLDFVSAMKGRHNLPLDHVYTAKGFWAVMDLVGKGQFARGSTILFLHTGGLQGSVTGT